MSTNCNLYFGCPIKNDAYIGLWHVMPSQVSEEEVQGIHNFLLSNCQSYMQDFSIIVLCNDQQKVMLISPIHECIVNLD